ncbi:MAG: DarT ssDNA thymidine ADP-ribosyltransferase family protein [Candidatus Binatia bacterium]
MNLSDLAELHYITPIANVSSILKLGILSNREIAKRRIQASSVASSGVQERRAAKIIPRAKPLHE